MVAQAASRLTACISIREQRDMRMDLTLIGSLRHDWTLAEVESLFAMPFVDLLFHAQRIHRQHHEPSTVQMSTLLSIKTGACPEDCAYCPQSVRYDTGLERETLLDDQRGRGRRAARERSGRHPLLHGRSAIARPKPKQVAAIAADDSRGARARHGDLRHARHAHARPRRRS